LISFGGYPQSIGVFVTLRVVVRRKLIILFTPLR